MEAFEQLIEQIAPNLYAYRDRFFTSFAATFEMFAKAGIIAFVVGLFFGVLLVIVYLFSALCTFMQHYLMADAVCKFVSPCAICPSGVVTSRTYRMNDTITSKPIVPASAIAAPSTHTAT